MALMRVPRQDSIRSIAAEVYEDRGKKSTEAAKVGTNRRTRCSWFDKLGNQKNLQNLDCRAGEERLASTVLPEYPPWVTRLGSLFSYLVA